MAEKKEMRNENIKKARDLLEKGQIEALLKEVKDAVKRVFKIKGEVDDKLQTLSAQKIQEEKVEVVVEPVKEEPIIEVKPTPAETPKQEQKQEVIEPIVKEEKVEVKVEPKKEEEPKKNNNFFQKMKGIIWF